MGSRQPRADEDARDRRRAIARSPSARMVARAAIGLDDGIQLIDVRTGARARVEGHPRVEPDLAAVQPGRQDDRVDEPRRDGDRLGCRCADSPRDAAWALGLGLAAGLQPRREDALHGEHRRDRDRLGPEPGAAVRTSVHVHARPRALATGRTRHPGKFSPDGRLIAVGLNDGGIRLRDCEDARRRSAYAPLADRRRGHATWRSVRTGKTLAAVTRAAWRRSGTWSRDRCVGDRSAPAIRGSA